jgi:hypothetical protein
MATLLYWAFRITSSIKAFVTLVGTVIRWWLLGERWAWKRKTVELRKQVRALQLELRAAEADRYRREEQILQLKSEKEVVLRVWAESSTAHANHLNGMIAWLGKAALGFGPGEEPKPPAPPPEPPRPSMVRARDLLNDVTRDTIAQFLQNEGGN